MKYWAGIQWVQSYFIERRCLLALVGHPSCDGIVIKIPHGVDLYYIIQSRTPSFPIGLVKIKSDFIVKSVETGLGR